MLGKCWSYCHPRLSRRKMCKTNGVGFFKRANPCFSWRINPAISLFACVDASTLQLRKTH